MSCPYREVCKKGLEDAGMEYSPDKACDGETWQEWSSCNIYQDLAWDVYRKARAETEG